MVELDSIGLECSAGYHGLVPRQDLGAVRPKPLSVTPLPLQTTAFVPSSCESFAGHLWKSSSAIMKLSPEFEKAAIDINKLEVQPPPDELLTVSRNQLG